MRCLFQAEIRTSNSADFQHSVMWLSSLQDLIIQLKVGLLMLNNIKLHFR